VQQRPQLRPRHRERHYGRRMAVHYRVHVGPRLVDFAVNEALAVKELAFVLGLTIWLSRSSTRMSMAVTDSGAIEREIR